MTEKLFGAAEGVLGGNSKSMFSLHGYDSERRIKAWENGTASAPKTERALPSPIPRNCYVTVSTQARTS